MKHDQRKRTHTRTPVRTDARTHPEQRQAFLRQVVHVIHGPRKERSRQQYQGAAHFVTTNGKSTGEMPVHECFVRIRLVAFLYFSLFAYGTVHETQRDATNTTQKQMNVGHLTHLTGGSRVVVGRPSGWTLTGTRQTNSRDASIDCSRAANPSIGRACASLRTNAAHVQYDGTPTTTMVRTSNIS